MTTVDSATWPLGDSGQPEPIPDTTDLNGVHAAIPFMYAFPVSKSRRSSERSFIPVAHKDLGRTPPVRKRFPSVDQETG